MFFSGQPTTGKATLRYSAVPGHLFVGAAAAQRPERTPTKAGEESQNLNHFFRLRPAILPSFLFRTL